MWGHNNNNNNDNNNNNNSLPNWRIEKPGDSMGVFSYFFLLIL